MKWPSYFNVRFSSNNVIDGILSSSSVLISLFMAIYIYHYCYVGYEFTDEGFYLSWVKDPFYQPSSATQFGFIYSVLYWICREDLGFYRFSNFIVTYALSVTLYAIVLRQVFGSRISVIETLICACAFSTLSATMLIFSGTWLPSPSYNHLALQSLLIAAIGLSTIDRETSLRAKFGWTVLSVGGWMAFMAKPTTAGALAILAFVYLLISGKSNFRYLAYAIVLTLALLLASALWINGSIEGFVERLESGSEMYILLGAGHAELFRMDTLSISKDTWTVLCISVCIIVCVALFLQPISMVSQLLAVFVGFGAVAWLGISILFRKNTLISGDTQGMVVLAIPLALVFAAACLKQHFFSGFNRSVSAIGFVFVLLPAAFSFGTNANYWVGCSQAGCFLVLAGLIFLREIPTNVRIGAVLFPVAIGTQALSLIQVQAALENPYRQPQSLLLAAHEIVLGHGASKLYVSEGFARYLDDAIKLAHQSAFTEGTPVVDLTGQSPGTLYAIGAANIGQPWTVGGYPGSAGLATIMLGKASCDDLGRSWLLSEPGGPRSISLDVLLSFGADAEKDYIKVGALITAPGVGGYSEVRTQYLLKPRRSLDEASRACLAKRGSVH
jgi:hypothetical protein